MGSKATLYLRPSASLLLCLALVLFLPAAAQGQRGALTLQRDLGTLVERAATIVRGHVVSARVEPHPQFTHLTTLVITLRVEEALKGQADKTFTFRQYIWDIRDRYDAAGYRKGQHLLLLMNKVNEYGLTSPAGMEQGRFRILRDAQGREVAVNGRGNAGLFRDLASQLTRKGIKLTPALSALLAQHQAGPIALPDLEDIIRAIAKAN